MKKNTAKFLINGEGWPGLEKAQQMLEAGAIAIDVAEQAIRLVEAEPKVITVGYGGRPNLLGEMELDAAVMDGNTFDYGAVGAVKLCKHPVSLARKVLEKLPHVMLVGNGADLFAKENNLDCSSNKELLSEEASAEYQEFLDLKNISRDELNNIRNAISPSQINLSQFLKDGKVNLRARHDVKHDTVVMLVQDNYGNSVSATSTSGWFFKYPGRLGDTSIPGAGFYVDSTCGGALCTHTGENSMRCLSSKRVVDLLREGKSVGDALRLAVAEQQQLHGGHLGTLVIHALNNKGEHQAVVCRPDDKTLEEIHYYYWEAGMQKAERVLAQVIPS